MYTYRRDKHERLRERPCVCVAGNRTSLSVLFLTHPFCTFSTFGTARARRFFTRAPFVRYSGQLACQVTLYIRSSRRTTRTLSGATPHTPH